MGVNVTRYFVIPVLGLILFFTNSGYSIRCWNCDSSIDPRCGDPFTDNSTTGIVDCALIYDRPSQNPVVKFTVCGKIKYYKGNTRTPFIARVCIQEERRGAEFACNSTYQLNYYGRNSSCSACSYDFCNSAPASSQITSALLLVPVIMFLTKITIL